MHILSIHIPHPLPLPYISNGELSSRERSLHPCIGDSFKILSNQYEKFLLKSIRCFRLSILHSINACTDKILIHALSNESCLWLLFIHFTQMVSKGLKNSIRNLFSMRYRKISNIRCTKSKNLNVSRLLLQLYLCNILKPVVKSRMKM